MHDVDIPIPGFKVSEILVSDISGDKLRVLGKVKPEEGRHSNCAVTVSDRLVGCLVRRMNDQQPAVSPELFVHGADHGPIQGCDSIRLVPAISGDQDQTCAGCIAG